MDELTERNQRIANMWQIKTESGVIVHPLQASVQAMENLGCDMTAARDLLPQAQAQYDNGEFGRLLGTFARINAILAGHLALIRADEPSTWDAYRRNLPDNLPSVDGCIDSEAYNDRVKGAWLGKCIGTALGDPVEGWSRQAIQAAHGWISDYLVPPKTLNDDTAYPILVLHAMDAYGCEFTSEQLGLEWIEHLPFAFTAEQAALDNITAGHMPPESRWPGNPCGAWVGAQMRGEIHGLVAPLSPEVAAEYAFRDAVISHYREGVHGEIYAAALVSLAFAELPMEDLLTRALAFVPQTSPLVTVVEQTILSCHRHGQWEAVARDIEQKLASYHWIHTLPNIACVIAGLILGEGDFERTILTTLACGFDTDCSVGQAAALLGTLFGAQRLPAKWCDPIGDALDTYVLGYERIDIDMLTAWTTKWGRRIALDKIV